MLENLKYVGRCSCTPFSMTCDCVRNGEIRICVLCAELGSLVSVSSAEKSLSGIERV